MRWDEPTCSQRDELSVGVPTRAYCERPTNWGKETARAVEAQPTPGKAAVTPPAKPPAMPLNTCLLDHIGRSIADETKPRARKRCVEKHRASAYRTAAAGTCYKPLHRPRRGPATKNG